MRIGFDAKRYFHNQTGLGNFSRSLINGFKSEHPEHDYFLFTSKLPDSSKLDSSVITKSGLGLFWRQFGISQDIEKQKLDLFHGLSGELPYSKPQKVKLVVTIHDLIFMKYPAYYKTIDRLIYAHKTSNAIEKADVIIASSEQTKRDIEQLPGNKHRRIEVVYQDCNPLFYNSLPKEKLEQFRVACKLPSSFLLMVSKFEKRKNHLRLLQAYKEAKCEAPLVFVGRKGDSYSEVVSFIAKHKLKNSVTVFDDVKTEDLPAFYQLADASLFPSEYEGFGIPVLESLASGTPVLTSESSCMQEISEDAGLYVNPLSVESIASGLAELTSKTKLTTLQKNIPNRLTYFENSKLLNEHLNVYNSLLC